MLLYSRTYFSNFTRVFNDFMEDNFSPRVKDVIYYSKEEALRLGHDFIGTEHLILGLLRDGNRSAIDILNALQINFEVLKKK